MACNRHVFRRLALRTLDAFFAEELGVSAWTDKVGDGPHITFLDPAKARAGRRRQLTEAAVVSNVLRWLSRSR